MGAGTGERIAAACAPPNMPLSFATWLTKAGLPEREVADHVVLVRGGAAREHGGQEGRSAGAADVAGEVGEAGDVVVLRLLHADVGDGVDGDEEEGEAGGLEAAQKDEVVVADAEIHGVHGDQRRG